jgi:hypothetical protein
VALGQVFSEYFDFPLPIYIPSASPQSSSLSPEAGTIGQEWPQCQQPQNETKNENITRTQRTCFLRSTQDDKLQSDYRVGINRSPLWLLSGSWGSCYFYLLIFNLNSVTSFV